MIHHKPITDSTNLDARGGRPGDVFIADFQTAGRGRLDHRWQSAKAENLTFSIVLDVTDRPPAEVATLPLVVGLAVMRGLPSADAADAHPKPLLKWPNDILCGGRKLCGILCERNGDRVIAGVGVNVNQTVFAPDIADRATSLSILSGRPLDRAKVLSSLVASISAHHERWRNAGFAALWPEFAACDALSGRIVSVYATDTDPAPIVGICGGIQSDGSLLVGGSRVYAGEAHVDSVRG